MENRVKIICLTPVKNEDWILENFLRSTSIWADHIIIADQNSIDNTKQIATGYEKVIYVENNESQYDELSRQELLLKEARKISGKKLLIALDADEFFTNIDTNSPSWQTMLNAKEGTVFSFNWLHISPDFSRIKKSNFDFPWGAFGFMDDEKEQHKGRNIHSPRLPIPNECLNICIKDNWVIHFNLVSEERLKSKNRWYMAHETINNLRSNPIFQNQYYNYDNFFSESEHFSPEIFKSYLQNNIDLYSIRKHKINFECQDTSNKWKSIDHHWRTIEYYWWDYEVLKLIEEHGAKKFKYIDIWDFDWKGLALYLSFPSIKKFEDPRGVKEKLFIKWVRYSNGKNSFSIKIINRIIRLL